jgi:hypothetical protein
VAAARWYLAMFVLEMENGVEASYLLLLVRGFWRKRHDHVLSRKRVPLVHGSLSVISICCDLRGR